MIVAGTSWSPKEDDCIRLSLVAGKMTLVLVVAAIVIVASAATVAWAVDRSERGVVLTVHTDKKEYAPGEPVEIHIQLKNYGFRTVELIYNTSITSWYSIYDSDGEPVFAPKMIGLQVITHVILKPGETMNGGGVWNQVDNTGDQVERPDFFTVSAFSNRYNASTSFLISD